MTAAQVRAGVLMILLAVCTVEDICRQQVFVPVPAAGILTGLLITAFCQDASWLSVTGGILAGGAIILFARWSKGAVGAGDGWVLAACGSLLGIMQSMALLLAASLLMLPVSAALILKGKKKTEKVPFVPFLAAAYLMQPAAEWIQTAKAVLSAAEGI